MCSFWDRKWSSYCTKTCMVVCPKPVLRGAYSPLTWTFTLGATGSRSAFSWTSVEWRPSGIARLGFPLTHWGDIRLSGNVSFAAGTENFAIVDQIGSFASQTYGGGLRLRITDRQDLTECAGYQKRTQNRTHTMLG